MSDARPAKTVFFLDIARNSGWCEGPVGGTPQFGSVRLAPDGSDSPAVFSGLLQFLGTRFQAFRPNMFVYEAPRDPRHMGMRTSAAALRMLIGLPAVAEATAYAAGVWDIREAEASSIRAFLLPPAPKGKGRKDKGQLKREVFEHVQSLGFEAKNYDESDAVAGWLYACSVIDGQVGVRSTPLFSKQDF
ncbi:hypothetical protein [Devosia ginsengisoli]|uniref:hypothetical protein n=1 Tax=Devosia ginsengisoli TaxID=400770 RepID=UPI0026F05EC5|nr:hypothetical protein [Devosia ginsengisoli]MCR6673279.1 hypothetical protein [Devosia ginsengisoli]